jgi:hypothetical protein
MKNCFVLMPFSKEFDDIYQLGIKSTCDEMKMSCKRVDEQIFHHSILQQIYNQIENADILIADLTNQNPNVFYEVGYAHGLNKNVILLTKNTQDIPFDLKHYPHIIYEDKILNLKRMLKSKLEHFQNTNDFYLRKHNWMDLITGFDSEPITISNIILGEVMEYKYSNNNILYRLIPEPYETELDNFYKDFDGLTLTNIIAKRKI